MNVEKSASSSNIQDILSLVTTTKASMARKAFDPNKSTKESKLTIHKMVISDAGATVPFWGRVAVPDVQCNDFDKATEGKARTVRPIVFKILQEFCQTGQWAGEVMPEKAFNIAEDHEDIPLNTPD